MLDWLTAKEALQKQTMNSVYLLLGEETVLIQRFLAALTRQLEQQSGSIVDINRFRFDESGCEDALFACQSLSLFGASSIVVLENCTCFLASSKSKHDVTGLEAYLANPVPDKTLVLTVHADKLDERKKLAKLMKIHSVVNCTTPREEVGRQIVLEIAQEKHVSLSRGAQGELWRRCRTVSRCAIELDKLNTYTRGKEIEQQDVVELVTPPLEDNVFNWIDGVISGNAASAFAALSDVKLAGYDPFALLSLITRQLRVMWYAMYFGQRRESHQQIATRVGAHPYAVKVASEQAKNVSLERIEELLLIVADAEFFVKSGRRDIEHALDWVVMSCAASSKKHLRAH